MIALVGNEFGGRLERRAHTSRRKPLLGPRQRRAEGRGVAAIAAMNVRRHHGAGVEIDGVFRLVRKPRATVLHARDPRLRIARAGPFGVADLLGLAPTIEPPELVVARRLDAALGGELGQHLAPALARLAAGDDAHRRVRFHGRGVDPDAFALDQTGRGEPPDDPVEYPPVGLERQPRPRLRKRRVVGHRLRQPEPEEAPERQRIGAAPSDPALGIDALEVADQQHPEVPSRRHRRPPHDRRVERRAHILDEAVEARRRQNRVQPIVERVPRRARHVPPRHHQIGLNRPLLTQRHVVLPKTDTTSWVAVNHATPTFSTAC